MPTYDYHCTSCGDTREVEQKITASPLTTCLKCHAETYRRGPGGGIGLLFKGSGFYKTDYSCSQEKEKSSTPCSSTSSTPKVKTCCPCNKKH